MAFLKDSMKTVHNAASMLKDTTSSVNARVSTLERDQVSPVPVIAHKVITHKVSTHRVITHRVITHKVITHKVITHRVITHRVITHRVITHKVITHKVITHRVITHKVITHRVITHKVITHKVITHKVITHKVITHRVITHKVTVDSVHKHSDVADMKEDGDRPTLNATIVDTPTDARIDPSLVWLPATQMPGIQSAGIGRQDQHQSKEEWTVQEDKQCDKTERCRGKSQRIRT